VGDNFEVFYLQQAPNFVVPKTTYNSDGTPNMLGAPSSGLTNQQAWTLYGTAIAGEVLPTGAVQRQGIIGYVLSL
jgi:hypothetical protein